MLDNANRFLGLFRGNERSHGVYFPKTGKVTTVQAKPLLENFQEHIKGKLGVGVVPIMDDSNCWFGAIDIDAHGDLPDIDLDDIEGQVRKNDLPLVVCRSKSGGVHLYLFLTEPTPAKLVRKVLAKWAALVGQAGVEIFPKQDSLPESGGERQYGNWINLPYLNGEDRYAYEGGRPLTLGHFLDIAESRRVKPATLVEKADGEHGEAPPCIQKMIAKGVRHGQRNEALYNMVIYLKKLDPEDWRTKAFDFNAKLFEEALPHGEAKKTIESAGRRSYRYRCKEEPCRSYCNSAVCVQRKFGITPEEKSELDIGSLPEFNRLEKYTTDPVRWILYVDGTPITLATLELMDYRSIRRAVADNLTCIIPPMKNATWEVILHNLMGEAKIIEAPEEASTYGFLRTRLYEFFQRTDLSSEGDNIEDRKSLLMGSPVVQAFNNRRCVFFRGADFVDFLKKNRSEEMKGTNLWMALRKVGVKHDKLRVGGKVVPVWFLPVTDDDFIEIEAKGIEPEL
jgi:hypothetical protein